MSAGKKRFHTKIRYGNKPKNVQCLGKLRFKTMELAVKHMEVNKKVVRSYRCQLCHWIHATSIP